MEKISEELALAEVQKWLDFKKVDEDAIDNVEKQKKEIAKSISRGHLILKKDMSFEHILKFPILDDGGKPFREKLVYRPRLKLSEVERETDKVNMSNSFQLIRAYISALTGENSGIIKGLDTSDQKIATSIAIFFL